MRIEEPIRLNCTSDSKLFESADNENIMGHSLFFPLQPKKKIFKKKRKDSYRLNEKSLLNRKFFSLIFTRSQIRIIKTRDNIAVYLTAYYLAERFNSRSVNRKDQVYYDFIV